MSLLINHQSDGQFAVEGDLTFTTIGAGLTKLFAFLDTAQHITVDFSKVNLVDSAALALLIEWRKYASQQKVQLVFKNIPKQLFMLAQLSGLNLTSHFTIQPATQKV